MPTNVLTEAFTHTYAGKEILSPIFFDPQVFAPSPFENFQVLPNISTSANIYLPNKLEKVITADGGCGFTATGTTTIDDKTITPVKLKINLEQCSDEFDNTIFAESMRKGTDINDLIGTDIGNIILTVVQNALRSDVPKLSWGGESADADAFYGTMNGYIDILDAATTAGTIGANVDMTTQGHVVAGAYVANGALGALRELYENMPMTLRAIPRNDLKIMCTASTVDNLLTSYEALGTDSGLNNLINGDTRLRFRGIDIIEYAQWDEMFTDATFPAALNAKVGSNMIVITTPKNLIIASDVSDVQSQLDVWYDKKDELVFYKVKFKLGAAIVHEELVVWGTDN